jgi:hypothetical protein
VPQSVTRFCCSGRRAPRAYAPGNVTAFNFGALIVRDRTIVSRLASRPGNPSKRVEQSRRSRERPDCRVGNFSHAARRREEEVFVFEAVLRQRCICVQNIQCRSLPIQLDLGPVDHGIAYSKVAEASFCVSAARITIANFVA